MHYKLEESNAPLQKLLHEEIKLLLYADDVILMY